MKTALDNFSNQECFCRRINKNKSKDYSRKVYGPITGKLLGYAENDEHLRLRIDKELKKTK